MTAKGGTLPDVAALFVFLTAFIAYAWTASPAMGWLDSPEFVAASASLGVPHSPGHPLPVLLGKLGALLPVGDIAFRVNLMSALAAAGAAALLQRAGCKVARTVAPDLPRRAHEFGAAALALGFALSWTVWFQGLRAEVYALTALLSCAFLNSGCAALASEGKDRGREGGGGDGGGDDSGGRDPRPWLAAGLWAGLALATHHFIALTVVVPAALVGLWRRPGLRLVSLTMTMAVLGLAAFLYLPVRSAQHPEVNWGAPHTAERFAWTVSARAFHKAVTVQQVSTPAEDAAQVVATLAEQATWPLFLAALLGLYLGVRSRRFRALALMLAGVVAAGAAGRVLVGFDPDIPDSHGYLMPTLAALFLLALAGLFALAQALLQPHTVHERQFAASDRDRRGELIPGATPIDAGTGHRILRISLVIALAALAPVQLARFGRAASLAGARASDQLAHWELDGLPPRAVLLSAYFQTSFRLWAARTAWAARPDVAILDRSFLTYPGAAAEARRAHPELAGLIDAPLRAGAPTPVTLLAELARHRPVMVQLHPNLEPAVEPWLLPWGPFARLGSAPPGSDDRDRAEAADAALRRQLIEHAGTDLPPGDRRGLHDALLWHDVVRLGMFCRQSRLRAARLALEDALALAPGDRILLDMAARCGLPASADSPGP